MLNMETSIHRRRRILLHFLVGIGLPSVLLGYLAFRGIQNDMALLEREQLNQHNKIAQQITNSINDKISAVEEAFLDSIANHQVPQPDSDVLRSLDLLKSQYNFVEEVFLFDSAERIRLPLAKILFLPAGSLKSLAPQPLPSAMLLGQQYEFQQKSYPQALTSYKQVFAQVSSNQTRAEMLNAIARVQSKSKLFRDAIKSYKAITQDYSDIRLGSGVPSGLAAQLEIGALFLEIDDPTSAAETFISLYQDMIDAKWTLEKTQYEFFAEQIEESIDEIISQNELLQSYQKTFEILRNEQEQQRVITERLLAFQDDAATDLLAKVPQNIDNSSSAIKRFTLDIGGRMYLVSIPGEQKANGNQVNMTWGLLLNPEQLKANLHQSIIPQHIPAENIHWIVKGRDAQTILKSDDSLMGTRTARVNFARNFPPWSLELYQQDPRLFETMLTSRRGIYLYMFVLLAGILIFGLTLTIRIVTHELELGKMKSDFVSTVSHEFKSPLTSIRQLAEMLQSGRVPSAERRQRYYNVLLEQSERLSLLIDNILDFAKMEEGKKEFEFETADIRPQLEELISTIQQQVRHEGFTLQADIDTNLPSIKVDHSAITQAITNLIDNAIKYSAEAKKIYVRCFTEGQHLIIAVQDFGVGIRPEEIDKVFDRFYRGGDELTRTVKGSGLGLTLVKQIVQAHQGSVHVESEQGSGSTFSIKLPLQLTET
jgi:signal transduction histidine kinase